MSEHACPHGILDADDPRLCDRCRPAVAAKVAPKPSERLVSKVDAEPKPAVVSVFDPRTGREHRVSESRAAVLLSRGFTKTKA